MFPRTQEASDLLSEIIKHGAVEGNLGKHYLAVNNQDEHFLQLRNLGFIKYLEDTGDSIVATKKALHAVQPTLVYFSPAHIHEYMSDTVPAEPNMTVIDLLLALLVAGWSEKGFPKKNQLSLTELVQRNMCFITLGLRCVNSTSVLFSTVRPSLQRVLLPSIIGKAKHITEHC